MAFSGDGELDSSQNRSIDVITNFYWNSSVEGKNQSHITYIVRLSRLLMWRAGEYSEDHIIEQSAFCIPGISYEKPQSPNSTSKTDL
jgi:hypothetical protein